MYLKVLEERSVASNLDLQVAQTLPYLHQIYGQLDSLPYLILIWANPFSYLGPVVQSIVSLTSSLVVKMLTVLVSTIFDSHVFFWKNMSSFFKCKSYSHFFNKTISVYAIFNDQSFNDTLTTSLVLNNWALLIYLNVLDESVTASDLGLQVAQTLPYLH